MEKRSKPVEETQLLIELPKKTQRFEALVNAFDKAALNHTIKATPEIAMLTNFGCEKISPKSKNNSIEKEALVSENKQG